MNNYLESMPIIVMLLNDYTFLLLELSKYLERKEELELIKINQQQQNCIKIFGVSKHYTSSTERKTKLELPKDGNKMN